MGWSSASWEPSALIARSVAVPSLAPTVIARLAGWPAVLVLRREWGLYGFKYALVHLLAQVTLDYGGALGVWVADVLPKWYALMGMASLLLMVPLAITSAPGWVARLGVWWKRLHRLAYVAAGRLDAFFERDATYAWDVAAGSLMIQEAGGRCEDLDGGALNIHDRNVSNVLGTINPVAEITRQAHDAGTGENRSYLHPHLLEQNQHHHAPQDDE